MNERKNKKQNSDSVDQLVKMLYDEPSSIETKEHLISKDPLKDNFEIFNFLEKEYKRLIAIDQFLTKKLPIKLNFDQTERLIEHESTQLNLLKEELIEQLLPVKSKFNNELKQIWDQTFSQK